MPRLIPENQYTSTGWHSSYRKRGLGGVMEGNYNSFIIFKNMISGKSHKEILQEVLPLVSKNDIDYYFIRGFIEFIEDTDSIVNIFSKVINFAEDEIIKSGNKNLLLMIAEFKSLAELAKNDQHKLLELANRFKELSSKYNDANLIYKTFDPKLISDGGRYFLSVINKFFIKEVPPSNEVLISFLERKPIAGYESYYARLEQSTTDMVNALGLPVNVFKPILYQIVLHLKNKEHKFAYELATLCFYHTISLEHAYKVGKGAPKRLGAKGGRKEHLRKNFCLNEAELKWREAPSMSLEEMSIFIYSKCKSHYNDSPKAKTIKDWLRNASFRPVKTA
ncbi:hypothetical protein ISO42_04720 [Morganella morganii subsp. morganii]|uniref:hypothetical protein n=1 Tax=Morganella morganii TaxID=582 RepID=UPI001BDB129C|nr:hypothetical protein [Morganella morganii]MBT0511365.1 hypothetical protein [Morganella morganii subsp. morganii]